MHFLNFEGLKNFNLRTKMEAKTLKFERLKTYLNQITHYHHFFLQQNSETNIS